MTMTKTTTKTKTSSGRRRLSTRYLYKTYRPECEEAFPATIEFTQQETKSKLPLKPLYKPELRVTIPVPLYFAGFMVSAGWLFEWNRRNDAKGIHAVASRATPKWAERGKEKPFMTPTVYPWPTGDYMVYFISYPASRGELEYFYDNRDAILDRYLDLMDFPSHEREIIKTRLFKWYRLMRATMSTREDLMEDLPEDMCLQYVSDSE
ncbi:hypothetical protein CC1G_01645 [Coprinopsis cinerea okayama7|uniref:Uncharacterized protein n=1 Tax=Coprinopsis cinerea (strain Okayama-7 / 130 / ATCC MYA-4618 / FGSC 9003) TaxID=240176 RepID=A8NIC7_COPC7|nr:hypothetical protein CC1G_01645 [Coprinopsis cinerea okayama7\|eukprot:XP_001833968.2 hypothetical protein CC1G_01645 [Coprinopsis cinerea okayama7\